MYVREWRVYPNVLDCYLHMDKEQIVQMLAESDIMNYEKIKKDFGSWNLYPISQEDILLIFTRALTAYEVILEEILKDLD